MRKELQNKTGGKLKNMTLTYVDAAETYRDRHRTKKKRNQRYEPKKMLINKSPSQKI